MIVSCPSCGTHYKHQVPSGRARARCGACATTIDLSTLRPYRIVSLAPARPEDLARASAHLTIGLDEPSLATAIAANVGPASSKSVPLAVSWDETESLPAIPEMQGASEEFELEAPGTGEEASSKGGEVELEAEPAPAPSESRVPIYAFWAAGGAIVGTGTSWTLGGTTSSGIAAGAAIGVALAWGWMRWTSRR